MCRIHYALAPYYRAEMAVLKASANGKIASTTTANGGAGAATSANGGAGVAGGVSGGAGVVGGARPKGLSAAELAGVKNLFTEVQRVIESKQLQPTLRTVYMRTAFQARRPGI
jgi:hypothetical protein